ncbi:MAG: hypothetical protein ACOYXW_13550 [Actinomycetota bacterium]
MAAVLLAVLTVTACGGSGTAPESAPSTTATSTTPTVTEKPSPDPSSEAAKAALDAYLGFRRAQVAAEATADAGNTDLAKYAGDKALADERVSLVEMAKAGVVMTGEPIFHPEVTDVSLGTSPTVTITDCIDRATWTPIYQATGKSAIAPNQPERLLAIAQARPYGDGWVITDITTDRSRTC